VRGLLIWFLIILAAIFAFVLGVLFYKKRQAKKELLKRSDHASKSTNSFLEKNDVLEVVLESPFIQNRNGRKNSTTFARVSTNIFLGEI